MMASSFGGDRDRPQEQPSVTVVQYDGGSPIALVGSHLASLMVSGMLLALAGCADGWEGPLAPARDPKLGTGGAFVAATDAGPDFNGDGFADLAVGLPYENVAGAVDAGAIQVIYGSPDGLTGDKPIDDLFWTEKDYELSTISSEPKDYFGKALAAGDFDGDGFDDLAIGVPNQDVIVSGTGVSDAGAVYVMRGSSSGLRPGGGRFTQALRGMRGRPDAGDHFGFSLTAGNFGRGPMDDLAVGVPHEDPGLQNAGEVNVLYGSAGGLTARGMQLFNPSRIISILGHYSPNDRYGFALKAADLGKTRQDDLVVGVPYSGLPQQRRGLVHVIYGSLLGLRLDGQQLWHQNRRDIPGVGQPDDRFGYSLAAANFGRGPRTDLAIGVPGDGPKPAAGSALVLYGSSSGLTARGVQHWYRGSAGIQGKLVTGASFGYSLAAADFGRGPFADLAIGAPFDRFKGTVNILFGSGKGLTAVGNAFIWQDGSSFEGDVEGTAEERDDFGSAMIGANFGRGSLADLAVGVPGEDQERLTRPDKDDVGAVNVFYSDGDGPRWSDDQFWWQASESLHDQAESGDRFGYSFAN